MILNVMYTEQPTKVVLLSDKIFKPGQFNIFSTSISVVGELYDLGLSKTFCKG